MTEGADKTPGGREEGPKTSRLPLQHTGAQGSRPLEATRDPPSLPKAAWVIPKALLDSEGSVHFQMPPCLGLLPPPLSKSPADSTHLSQDPLAEGATQGLPWVPSTAQWVCDLHKAAACHAPLSHQHAPNAGTVA